VASASFCSAIGGQLAFAGGERGGVAVLRPALQDLAAVAAGQPVDVTALAAAAKPYPPLGRAVAAVTAAAAGSGSASAAGRVPVASALVDLITAIGNSSKLTLDPDLNSFHLVDAQMVQLPKALLAGLEAEAPVAGGSPDHVVAERAVIAAGLAGAAQALTTDVDIALHDTRGNSLSGEVGGLRAVAAASGLLASTLMAHLDGSGALDLSALARAVTDPSGLRALDSLLISRMHHLSSRRTNTLLLTAIGLLFAVWLGAAVWQRTRRDFGLTVDGVRALAARDLEPRPLPDGRDEMGDIGRAVGLARQVLVAQGERLCAADLERAEQQRTHYRQQRAAEHEARRRAQAVIENNATTVSAELTAVLEQFRAVVDSASGIDRSVHEVDTVVRDVVAQTAEADRLVAALSQSLARVATVAELIDRVAEQTKLLSLNATIEAVRAGESGRGFAVVAGEVKQLATMTATSTGEIATIITSLELNATAMSEAITSMADGASAVDAANAGLSGVAASQSELVDRVTNRLLEALSHTESMLELSEQLPLRTHERVPAVGGGRLRGDGVDQACVLRDVSEGGARVRTESAPLVRTGQRIKYDGDLDGLTIRVTATVLRLDPGGDVALRFEELTADARRDIAAYVANYAVIA
jgi:methyl-accepting chemotaxis protein